MKRHILLIPAVSFLMLAPAVQHQVYGNDINNPVVQENSVVVSDDDLEDNVEQALESNAALAKLADDVDVDVDHGVVTLSGKVESPLVKSDIESQVKNIAGVKKVINNIEVKS
jgi:osmotically-inducible protein OsmY